MLRPALIQPEPGLMRDFVIGGGLLLIAMLLAIYANVKAKPPEPPRPRTGPNSREPMRETIVVVKGK